MLISGQKPGLTTDPQETWKEQGRFRLRIGEVVRNVICLDILPGGIDAVDGGGSHRTHQNQCTCFLLLRRPQFIQDVHPK